jgi:hypothetical protein
MTIPVVTECSKAPQPVDRDTFADVAEDDRRQPQWPQTPSPRRPPSA